MQSTSLSLLEKLHSLSAEEAWNEFDALYGSWIRRILRQKGVGFQAAGDIWQEMLQVAVVKIPSFRHSGRPGALRNWLRLVMANKLKEHCRRRMREKPLGGEIDAWAEQLANPQSDAVQVWDQEHNRHVIRRLFQMVESRFKTQSVEAFRRTFLQENSVAQVAADLEMTENAVRVAKSRVLAALREAGQGFVD